MYEGQWREGKKHGTGVLKVDGTIIKGEWINGDLIETSAVKIK